MARSFADGSFLVVGEVAQRLVPRVEGVGEVVEQIEELAVGHLGRCAVAEVVDAEVPADPPRHGGQELGQVGQVEVLVDPGVEDEADQSGADGQLAGPAGSDVVCVDPLGDPVEEVGVVVDDGGGLADETCPDRRGTGEGVVAGRVWRPLQRLEAPALGGDGGAPGLLGLAVVVLAVDRAAATPAGPLRLRALGLLGAAGGHGAPPSSMR